MATDRPTATPRPHRRGGTRTRWRVAARRDVGRHARAVGSAPRPAHGEHRPARRRRRRRRRRAPPRSVDPVPTRSPSPTDSALDAFNLDRPRLRAQLCELAVGRARPRRGHRLRTRRPSRGRGPMLRLTAGVVLATARSDRQSFGIGPVSPPVPTPVEYRSTPCSTSTAPPRPPTGPARCCSYMAAVVIDATLLPWHGRSLGEAFTCPTPTCTPSTEAAAGRRPTPTSCAPTPPPDGSWIRQLPARTSPCWAGTTARSSHPP